MNRERPGASASAGAGYEVKFGCDHTEDFLGLVASLKSRVDWRARRFDPGAKVWPSPGTRGTTSGCGCSRTSPRGSAGSSA